MLTTVLFDLDGTLLPMDQDAFVHGYFSLLAKKLAPHGHEPKALIDGIWKGTAAMVKNDGSQTNEAAFWQTFCGIFDQQAMEDIPLFEEFYAVDFQQAKTFCGFQPKAAELVRGLKGAGVQVALATNPIFPAIATESRIRWAGLEPGDFALYTTYENTSYCKPNPAYFQDVLRRLNADPAATLMVGNDASEDTAAQQTGAAVFLLTDCLLNPDSRDIEAFPHGDFAALEAYLRERVG
ncbi:MAG: HAD family hydrolase [Oscillospiraceae bacterium]|nr:HAD family hydrolase [Oscillospiraceae bacterium]